jgi:hypothetical protein
MASYYDHLVVADRKMPIKAIDDGPHIAVLAAWSSTPKWRARCRFGQTISTVNRPRFMQDFSALLDRAAR